MISVSYTQLIGLIYASDYGDGVSPEKWTTSLGEYNYGAYNWLYLGDYEWTISRSAHSSIYMGFAFTVKSDYEQMCIRDSNYLVVDDDNAALNAINFLKDHKLGRATFYPLVQYRGRLHRLRPDPDPVGAGQRNAGRQ